MTTSVRRQAFVDLSIIAGNVSVSARDAASSESVADVRADAYGHGLLPVARILADAGVRAFLVSDERDADQLSAVGLSAVSRAEVSSPHDVLGKELYGLDPASPTRAAMRLVGEVIAVKSVGAGRGVSYGYTYRTSKPTTLALVALGFADGIPRVASNRAPVQVGRFTGTVTGRIAMDQFVVDLDGNTATVGDDVVLFGSAERDEPTIHDWATATGLSASAIVSRLGSRIERLYAT